MSRDWTPKELYYADIWFTKEYGQSYRDMKATWYVGGKPLPDPYEDIREEVKERYPELALLFSPVFDYYKKYKDKEKILSVLDEVERMVKGIEEGKQGEGEPYDTVSLWYNGEKGFYSTERNNEHLETYIDDRIAHIKHKDIQKV